MKVLILEDFSGFGSLLKDALEQNGCKVSLVVSRKTSILGGLPDLILTRRKTGILSKFEMRLKLLIYLLFMPKVSVVLISNQSIIFQGLGFLILMILRFKSEKRFLSVCGLDSVLVREKIFPELPGSYDIGMVDQDFVKRHRSKAKCRLLKNIVKNCSGIIPISHSFYFGWRLSEFRDKVVPPIGIPFPTNASRHSTMTSEHSSSHVSAVHFSSRADKGTELIREAFNKINLTYGQKFSAKVHGRMDIDKFLNELWQTDIFVDRATGSTYGTINSLIALSMGKIVVTKFTPEEISAFGISDCPVISIDQSALSIINGLERAYRVSVFNRDEHKKKCFEFLKKHHAPDKIGADYLQTFVSS